MSDLEFQDLTDEGAVDIKFKGEIVASVDANEYSDRLHVNIFEPGQPEDALITYSYSQDEWGVED